MAVVLDEIVDDEYEPSLQEINEYAEWLGMDLVQDQELLWIARDGLKAPLPAAWRPCQSGDGDIFYFNFETGESEWDHPCDDHYRRVYRRAKSRCQAPVRVVSIHATHEPGSGLLTVSCLGSLNGEELAVLQLKPSVKMRQLRSLLAKQLRLSKRRLKIVLPDARLVIDDDDRSSLAAVMGIDCASLDEEEVVNKEEQRREEKDKRRKLKEQRAMEYVDRCQHLGGLALSPEAKAAAEEMQQTSDAEICRRFQQQGSASEPEPEAFERDSNGSPGDILLLSSPRPASTPPLAEDPYPSETSSEGMLPLSPPSVKSPSSRPRELRELEPLQDIFLEEGSPRLSFRNSGVSEPPFDSLDNLSADKAFPDSGLLKSVFRNNGFPDVLRQRPQSLRLRPIIVTPRQPLLSACD